MIGDKIKLLRENANLTQTEFGKLFHVSKQCVSRWENYEMTPTTETIQKMAVIFKVTTDFILELDSRKVISVDLLTENEIAHITNFINDLISRNEKQK